MSFDPKKLTLEQQRAAWIALLGTGWVPMSDVFDNEDTAILSNILRTQRQLEYSVDHNSYRILQEIEE